MSYATIIPYFPGKVNENEHFYVYKSFQSGKDSAVVLENTGGM